MSFASQGSAKSFLTIQNRVRTGQIITFALVQGVIFITAILLYLSIQGAEASQEGELTDPAASAAADENPSYLLVGMAGGATVIALSASAMIPAVMRRAAVGRQNVDGQPLVIDPDPTVQQDGRVRKLLGADMTATILGQALAEGPAVICAVFMNIDKRANAPAYLAMITLCLVVIAAKTPTIAKVRRFLDDATASRVG